MVDEYSKLETTCDQLRKQLAAAQENLKFVERWAVHHGSKPCIGPGDALAAIQHYPPIKAITKSYKDGVVPNTFDPWAEIDRLQAELTGHLAWVKFDYANPPPDGVYWLAMSWPEMDPDVDSEGRTVGVPTGEMESGVCMAELCTEEGHVDHQVVDRYNLGDHSAGAVITHYCPVTIPKAPK